MAFYLQPAVFKGIIEKIEQTRVNIADDTHWPNLESGKTRERDNFYLWAVTNSIATCFNVFDARSQKVANTFLGNLRGVLVTDGHASFKKLGSETLVLANDWYHLRRKVKAAEGVYPEECSEKLPSYRNCWLLASQSLRSTTVMCPFSLQTAEIESFLSLSF